MRIAFLNPWRNAAENHAFRCLREAAARIGHELVHCNNSDEVEIWQPEFVLAAASTQPKLNDVPHYGIIHEPRDRFLANHEYFKNLLTYDGYLTISDSLERFLRDVMYGTGRQGEIGFYYNTCQRQDRAADLAALLRDRRLIVTYFGTNWDRRRSRFFRLLSERDNVQICGPEHSWPEINPKSYGGTAAFDGESVQARYAANGVGLCLLSDLHLRDDVISNRIFEVTSVGAVAICCDIPWIRKHFGDSVYYIDQELPDLRLVQAVEQCVADMYADPPGTIAKAQYARAVFEQTFAAEILMTNAVDYHRRTSEQRTTALARAKRAYEPFISVIVRCGGRPLAAVGEALRSIAAQTYGQFEVIFVRYRDIDLAPLVSERAPNVRAIRIVDRFGGGRSATLWAGLAEVRGEYFAVLDDDDWWFGTHVERLFQPFPTGPLARFFAYAGVISEHVDGQPIMGGGTDRLELFKFGMEPGELLEVSAAFASHCFVASADLLQDGLLEDPKMATAEDSFLILSLLTRAEPRFSYAGTAVQSRGRVDQSDFNRHHSRFEDELTLRTRLFGRYDPSRVSRSSWHQLASTWASRPAPVEEHVIDLPDRIVHAASRRWTPASVEARECVATGYRLDKSVFTGESRSENPRVGSALIVCPEARWAYGALLALWSVPELKSEHLIVVEVVADTGTVAIGLLNASENGFVFRKALHANSRPQEVHIPVTDFTRTGRLVIQNWDRPERSAAFLSSIRIFR
jgi:hypothetical protein